MLKPLTNLSLKLFTTLFPSEKPLLFTGPGSTHRLARFVRASGSARPLLVTEKALLELGLLDDLLGCFEEEGAEVTVFDGIIPNPTFEVIEAGLRRCKKNDSSVSTMRATVPCPLRR